MSAYGIFVLHETHECILKHTNYKYMKLKDTLERLILAFSIPLLSHSLITKLKLSKLHAVVVGHTERVERTVYNTT